MNSTVHRRPPKVLLLWDISVGTWPNLGNNWKNRLIKQKQKSSRSSSSTVAANILN